MPTSIYEDYANELLARAIGAANAFKAFDQEAVDRIVYAVFKAGYDHRMDFARQALDETGTGVFEHKVIKKRLGEPARL
jgi:acyl-CoA reductase-like NAD-dependent aldehyde dehydrogenase